MATEHDGTPTPPEVSENATESARLPRTALLGVFGSSAAPSALILLPRGDTQTVSVGDTVAGGRVEAIGDDRVVLSRMGRQQILRLPAG
ncbi:pilus assembly protein PilZ [Sulfitobacter albidus]|uniref:Pilus assembly protein PilZ n=1 Tax=Sulfitobacter albidus TaxID=2829501 RepID=A0A975PNI3_9RHOB|nr:type II secretion system protein N [Sulfitobacter albidus]QUJ77882.1 pilus assembly protein PilZ [Sulfitobacter albidus]